MKNQSKLGEIKKHLIQQADFVDTLQCIVGLKVKIGHRTRIEYGGDAWQFIRVVIKLPQISTLKDLKSF